MGRGDRRTAKGKRYCSSYGKSRLGRGKKKAKPGAPAKPAAPAKAPAA